MTGTRVPAPSLSATVPVTVVGTEGPRPAAPPSPPASIPSRPGSSASELQSGQLTAGDHDDLLNPELYAQYVRAMLAKQAVDGVPLVDTRRVLTVAVQDNAGRPIPFADVTLTCADGNRLTLATLADGTAVFFPRLDRLGDSVRLTVGGGSARTIDLAGQSGAQRQTVTLAAAARRVTRFDLSVVIDATGSMSDELEFLKAELRAILADVHRSHPELDIRLGLVAYRDEGDQYVTRSFPFTGALDEVQANLAAQSAGGGGDTPEAMDQALIRALSQEWRPDAVRTLLLVADAPPHAANVARTWAAAEAARAMRVQIVPVAASGVDDLAQYVMRAMAAATQSRYLFLTDDSGIGNPHADPAVDCYLVTRLDRLVRRVLDSQISGRRIEPREGEVIRSVGTYDNGRCVLPADFAVPD
ncbi:MAG TPA: vWA domain-containing protein [Allosphingosinicella sp.]|nr:vWA domain-containing protein [Allosphingosinicella sp.]